MEKRPVEGRIWATYAISCAVCFSDQSLEGETLVEATKEARADRWTVAAPGTIAPGGANIAGLWVCPDCNPKAPEAPKLAPADRRGATTLGFVEYRKERPC